jgi:hypothetical protein
MSAIFVDRPEIVRLLIELGANIEARDNDGYTALMHARDNQTQTMINIITEAVRKREIREKNKQIRAQKMAFYTSMIKESPRDKSSSLLVSLYDELSNFNPYLLQDIDEYAFGEEEKEEGAEESKRGDAGARRKKSKNKRKKSRIRKRKSGTGKSKKSKRSKRKSVSRKYCLTTSPRKMGFSQKASCKAQGLLKRTSKKNKGKYIVSPKYKKRSRRSRK